MRVYTLVPGDGGGGELGGGRWGGLRGWGSGGWGEWGGGGGCHVLYVPHSVTAAECGC